ncbi:MAG: GDP-mannose 4,6-dehydratase [Planctomycetes bacterium]|nr:GDP-mannose 4,6-dehydratase [Planctomycetota bacterium]
MEIFVTGGAGFIGSHLCERLLERGDGVVVFDNFNDFYDVRFKERNAAAIATRRGCEIVRGDLRDRAAVFAAFKKRPFDAVVHLAALAGVRPSVKDPSKYNEVNIQGTINLLDAIRERPSTKFIFGSSSSVYGANSKTPFAESDPIEKMVSPYAVTKRAGEQFASCYHSLYQIPTVCLRFFTVYGPRQRPEMAIAKFASLIERGDPVPVFGDGRTRRDYTYVDDILDGVIKSIDRCGGYELFNLGESRTIELRELIDVLAREIGKPAKLQFLPPEPGDVPVTFADITKARAVLGYDPRVAIEDGVRRYVRWRREQNSL